MLRALASCLIVLCDGFASLLFEALVAELQRIPPDLEVNYSRYSLSAALRLLGAFFSVSRKIYLQPAEELLGSPREWHQKQQVLKTIQEPTSSEAAIGGSLLEGKSRVKRLLLLRRALELVGHQSTG